MLAELCTPCQERLVDSEWERMTTPRREGTMNLGAGAHAPHMCMCLRQDKHGKEYVGNDQRWYPYCGLTSNSASLQ